MGFDHTIRPAARLISISIEGRSASLSRWERAGLRVVGRAAIGQGLSSGPLMMRRPSPPAPLPEGEGRKKGPLVGRSSYFFSGVGVAAALAFSFALSSSILGAMTLWQ